MQFGMTPVSRRFFTAFYDAVSPLLKTPPLRPPHHHHAHPIHLRSRLFTTSPSCRITSYATRFFTASLSPPVAAAWGPRSRYVVSRGFAGFCAFTTVPVGPTPTSAAVAVTETAAACTSIDRRPLRSTFKRYFHHDPRRRSNRNGRRTASYSRDPSKPPKKPPNPNPTPAEDRMLDRINNIHRPTKDEMLKAATGFWHRLRIRTKWSLIRQMRPYNWEDITAFFSWLLLGQVVWIVVGTTTFVSIVTVLINSVFAQETLAGTVGNYLTKETGVKVVFESAIVPRWKDNCIQFRNVFVSRRPGQHSARNVQKGSPETAAAAAAAAVTADHQFLATAGEVEEEEDTNYTQFDVTIETVNVTLSFARWMNGKGLLKDVEIKGVRGVIDRTHVHWPEDLDPRTLKHEHQPGDFEIESFKLEDLLVTVHQPDGFRPFPVSIFSCDLPQLRKQWLFYDFLSANNMSGSFDDSLFTIHPRQSHGPTADHPAWKKASRLRIDGLSIDHLNRGITGPFSWIHDGNVDIVADVLFPIDGNGDLKLSELVQDIYDRVTPGPSSFSYAEAAEIPMIMDLYITLNDVRAAVPLFTTDLGYVNYALIRPIVAYINSRRTYIPIMCRVVKRAGEFDGSWTIYDSGLMDDLSAETYEAFTKSVADQQARRRRMKKVGLWSLQLAAQMLLMAMAGSVA